MFIHFCELKEVEKLNEEMPVVVFFFFFSMFVVLLFPVMGAGADDCKRARCSKGGPWIHFPFSLKDQQSENCGYPGFDVYCNEKNETMIDLPFPVNLRVDKINYPSRQLHLSDPQKCLPKKLQHLNFSSSPFNFSQDGFVYDLFLFNCSNISNTYGMSFVRCLSDSRSQFYATDYYMNSLSLASCTYVHKFPSVPWSIFDTIGLKWSEQACGRACEARGRRCAPVNNSTREFQCIDKPKTNKGGTSKEKIITGATLGSLVVVTAFAALIFLIISFIKDRENQKKIEGFLEDYKALKPTRFAYADIRRITNQFCEKLGEGGYGVVYKGKLSTEIAVAVKVLNNAKENGEEFVNEVSTIGRIHHVNVVRLVGFCAEGFRRVLVLRRSFKPLLTRLLPQDQIVGCSAKWEDVQGEVEIVVIHTRRLLNLEE